MEVVENTLSVPVEEFLQRPLFCFLATVDDGAPRVSPLWFHWEDDALWMIGDDAKTYPDRIRANPAASVAVVDFGRTTGRVEHVGMRGAASVEPLDPDLCLRLLERYLGPDREAWDHDFFGDPREWEDRMLLLRFDPETVVARDQSYVPAPGLEPE